jgi:hypothetical protein
MCLLAGYLLGMVTGPNSANPTLAKVASFNPETQQLCLEGKAASSQEGAKDGELCGLWRRTVRSATPVKGDDFKFVSVSTSGKFDGKTQTQVVIYGDVVK